MSCVRSYEKGTKNFLCFFYNGSHQQQNIQTAWPVLFSSLFSRARFTFFFLEKKNTRSFFFLKDSSFTRKKFQRRLTFLNGFCQSIFKFQEKIDVLPNKENFLSTHKTFLLFLLKEASKVCGQLTGVLPSVLLYDETFLRKVVSLPSKTGTCVKTVAFSWAKWSRKKNAHISSSYFFNFFLIFSLGAHKNKERNFSMLTSSRKNLFLDVLDSWLCP